MIDTQHAHRIAKKARTSTKMKLPGEMRMELNALLLRFEQEMVLDSVQKPFSQEVCKSYGEVLTKYQTLLSPVLAVMDFKDPFLLLKTVLDSSESC